MAGRRDQNAGEEGSGGERRGGLFPQRAKLSGRAYAATRGRSLRPPHPALTPTPPPPPHPTPHPQVRLANSEKEAESMRVGIQRVQSLEKDSEILRSQAAEYSKLLQQER